MNPTIRTGVRMFRIMMTVSLLQALYMPVRAQQQGIVYVTLFMHNEDTVLGDLSQPQTKDQYLRQRAGLIEFCAMIRRNGVAFNWESDWKFLLGVLQFDTPDLTASTGGKNLVRYLREDLGITVDPHSHEKYGYNYTDVAHLIDSLGAAPTGVIGGHIWDPASPMYQNWERFKTPLGGTKYPWSVWKGNILMGHGTPNHTADPHPSGVWRPKDKYHFWEDDPLGNVYAVGQFTGDIQGVINLVNLYRTGAVPSDRMLTISIGCGQSFPAGAILDYENNILKPLLDLRNRGEIKVVTFEELINEWKSRYASVPFIYNSPLTAVSTYESSTGGDDVMFVQHYPNPFAVFTTLSITLPKSGHLSVEIFDRLGKKVATLHEGSKERGRTTIGFTGAGLDPGMYICRVTAGRMSRAVKMLLVQSHFH